MSRSFGPICFWSRTFSSLSLSLSLSLSPSGSVHGRKLYRFPSLNLALSLLIDLLCLTFSIYHNSNPKIDSNFKAYRQNFGMGGMASLVDDLRRNGFAIEARVDNVWSHFSQFGHVLDVYLSKVKVADLYLAQLGNGQNS